MLRPNLHFNQLLLRLAVDLTLCAFVQSDNIRCTFGKDIGSLMVREGKRRLVCRSFLSDFANSSFLTHSRDYLTRWSRVQAYSPIDPAQLCNQKPGTSEDWSRNIPNG